jgi:hypothetical protein
MATISVADGVTAAGVARLTEGPTEAEVDGVGAVLVDTSDSG